MHRADVERRGRASILSHGGQLGSGWNRHGHRRPIAQPTSIAYLVYKCISTGSKAGARGIGYSAIWVGRDSALTGRGDNCDAAGVDVIVGVGVVAQNGDIDGYTWVGGATVVVSDGRLVGRIANRSGCLCPVIGGISFPRCRNLRHVCPASCLSSSDRYSQGRGSTSG